MDRGLFLPYRQHRRQIGRKDSHPLRLGCLPEMPVKGRQRYPLTQSILPDKSRRQIVVTLYHREPQKEKVDRIAE